MSHDTPTRPAEPRLRESLEVFAPGWVGRRAAWLLMAGFACVLLTFFGNLFFGDLHIYSK
jgi:hypothetical protein